MSDAVEPLDLDAIRERANSLTRGDHPAYYAGTPVADALDLLAEVERLRAAPTTARRDALTEAAKMFDVLAQGCPVNRYSPKEIAGELRLRAAREEDR